ncbi:MAG: ATP-binding cassette domain-containing protein [Verrucomicrobiales bacterium]|nr:ATP-binding cassette domain-containing protein [Verrucomicrobiales bacterium]
MARVVLDNVSKAFYSPKRELIQAVKNVSFSAENKELLVLVGPSGSGKSTLLRLIAGLDEVTSGTISIDSVVVNKVEPAGRDVAMVFQNFALYPHMTVYENLAFPLKLRKVARAETDRCVCEAAELLGLVACLDRLPKALSGGERQRVAVGRAIVRRPKVFLFDEPLSNLDAQMRLQMRTEIAALHRHLGATMIYVTHDQIEAMTLGDRVAVLRQGCIQQIGQPLALYHTPANLFVARFIGSPAMNLLRGRVGERDGQCLFEMMDKAPSVRLLLPNGLTDRLRSIPAGEKLLGFRPEQISLAKSVAPTSEATCNVLRARIQLLEPLGPETHLHAKVGEHTLIARIGAATSVAVGQEVALALDLSSAHLFDPETGLRL